MKIAFMGTPSLAVPCLDALARHHEIVAVVTQPDKEGLRGHKLLAPPVKTRALELGVPVLQPSRARDGALVAELAAYQPEAIAVVAYGQILPREVLELAPKGCVNLHFSLLPRWRGAAPVQYAIWHGDTVTGVTTQFMVEKLDAGDVIAQLSVPIHPDETSGQLLERLTPIGAAQLVEVLALLESGTAPRHPQKAEGITLAPTIKREAAQILWALSSRNLVNLVRAMNPWPVAWCTWKDEPLKVWRAEAVDLPGQEPGTVIEARGTGLVVAAGTGALRLLEVQPPGKGRMSGGDWARGARVEAGHRFE